MNKTVTDLGSKLRSKQFSSKYPRLERQNTELSPKYIPRDMKPYYPSLLPDEGWEYGVTKQPPLEGLNLIWEYDLKDLPCFNSLLIYRMLEKLYGEADILGGCTKAVNGSESPVLAVGIGIDWGYALDVSQELVAEVRSLFANNQFTLRFWSYDKLPKSRAKRETIGKAIADCLKCFSDAIEENSPLFDEEELKRLEENQELGIFRANIFLEKYNAGVQLKSLAENLDKPPGRRVLKFGEPAQIWRTGYIYLSSAVMFIISLETLVNILYELLRKSEFETERYKRLTRKGDLNLRLLSIHLFCEGFRRQAISPDNELWERLEKLRDFRNTVLHGNVTEVDNVYAIREGNNTFYYWPAVDFRGKVTERTTEHKFPVTMPQVNAKVVDEIRATVDDTVAALISAMDDDTRRWLTSWRDAAVIIGR